MELSQFLKEIDGNSLCFVSPREQAKRSSIGKKQSYNGACSNLRSELMETPYALGDLTR